MITCIGSLVIPFVVAYVALGPENFSSGAVEGSGLFYVIYAHFVKLGLVGSALGGLLGYGLQYGLRTLIAERRRQYAERRKQ